MTSLDTRDRAFLLTLFLSTGAGALASVAIETTLTIRRLAGRVPYPNLSNHPTLVIGVFLLCGLLIGLRLAFSHPQRGRAVSTTVASLVGALVGVAAAVFIWVVVKEQATGRESGMDLLNIPFLWRHGLIPILTGMGLGAVIHRIVRRPRWR